MPDDLTELDRRIADALTMLRSARARAMHSPTSETRWQETFAERTLDVLLDRRPRCQMRQQAELLALSCGDQPRASRRGVSSSDLGRVTPAGR